MRNARLCAAGIILLAGLYATAGGAAEAGGKIRPGDVIYVEVYRVPELSRVYLVGEDGAIRMPYVSPIPVGGMDEATAGQIVARSLEPILRNPRVTVSHSDAGMSSDRLGRTSDMRLEIIPLRNSNAEAMSAALEGMTSPGGSVSADPDTNCRLLADPPDAIKTMLYVVARFDLMLWLVSPVRK